MNTSTIVIGGLLLFALALLLLGRWQERRQAAAAAVARARFDQRHSHAMAEDTVVLAIVVDPLTERELLLGTLDHGAESFAVNPELFRERDDDVKARQWREQFDEALHELDARFAALAADLDDPLPSYWPSPTRFDELVRSVAPVTGAPVPTYLTLDEIGDTVGPRAVLEIIRKENEAPPVYSWTTSEYPMVTPVAVMDRPADAPRPNGRGRHERRWR